MSDAILPLEVEVEEFEFANLTNNTTNSSKRPDVLGPEYHGTLRVIILGIMFVVAVVGNYRVLWTLRQEWAKRGRMMIMTLNLTVADLLVAHMAVLGQFLWELLDRHWYLSNGACKIYKVMQTFAITSSNYVLVAIAVDRHEAVIRPLNPFIKARNLVLIAWLSSLIPSLPNLYVFVSPPEDDMGNRYCVSKFYTKEIDKSFKEVYLVTILILAFGIPFILLMGLYFRICFTIWKESAYFKDSANAGRQSSSLLPQAKKKTLNMTIAIVTIFFITNIPYVFQELMVAFSRIHLLNPNVIALFGIISASNSSLNPYIFLFFKSKNVDKNILERYKVTFKKKTENTTLIVANPTCNTSLYSQGSCRDLPSQLQEDDTPSTRV